MSHILPPELDFNFLKIKKQEGDFLKKESDSKEQVHASKAFEFRKEEISRIKKDLDYQMKRRS